MKVLLVYPVPPRTRWPVGSFRSRWVPSGLACLAGALVRAGHEVRVHMREERLVKLRFDWDAADAQLRRELTEFHPDMVGLSVTTPMVAESARIAQLAKELCGPKTLVIAGGPHPTAVPERMLQDCPSVDAVVLGEGDETIVELASAGALPSVAGLAIRQGDGCLRTAHRPPPLDLDSLAPIPYELFDMGFYTSPGRMLVRWLAASAMNIRTSRGCSNRCAFCAGHLVAGVGVRYYSVEHVVENVAWAARQFPIEAIHFEDDTIGADPSRLVELCGALRRRGLDRLKWDCCLRVDQASADLLAEMKSAGCIQVEYGFESGSQDCLERLGKGATTEGNRRAVELTRRAGLRVFADIMIGLPGETSKDLAATVDFIRWARPEVISAGCLCPLPGTAIYDSLPADKRHAIDWADYTYMDDAGFAADLTAMGAGRFHKLAMGFFKTLVLPHTLRGCLRDTPVADRRARRRLKRKLVAFALRHPIKAMRLP